MHPYFSHIRNCNDAAWECFTPFYIAGKPLGLLHESVAASLSKTAFIHGEESGFVLQPETDDFEGRGIALKKILHHLIAEKLVHKERFELYAVGDDFDSPPVALADRALMPLLGFASYGIHCNAYVKTDDSLRLWGARRSLTSHVDPGKLDHLVAGGQPYGLTLRENLAKEGYEEAGIPAALVTAAVEAGQLSYNRHNTYEGKVTGVRRDTLFIFDLELPADFVPQSMDGESGDFRLMGIDEIREKLLGTEFKFNVPLVLIDFLIRRGFMDIKDPDITALATTLRPA
jgi:8-oxo-dGTP pyrophosphatase MutT (NUDIX family)